MGATGGWHIGTSGWVYPHWKGVFYPETLSTSGWLPFYARHFSTVEVNSSFYRLPSSAAFARWRDQVPEAFLFAVKASRYLTHQKKLKDPEEPLRNLISRAEALGPKLGPLLYQLPPGWRLDLARLQAFLDILPAQHRHVFEFRDPSWHTDAVFSLLHSHGCGYCIMSAPGLPCHLVRTGSFVYVRMHGAAPQFEGSYPDDELHWWAARLAELRGSHDAYVYFNNDFRGHAVRNAQRLLAIVAER